MNRATILFLLKAAISGGLITLLVYQVDVAAVGERLGQLTAGWVALALFMLAALIGLAIIRWCIVLRVLSFDLPFMHVLKLVLIGQFFNQTLPSSLGGDAARVFYAWRAGVPPGSALNSVAIDRLMGLFVLIFLTTAIIPILDAKLGHDALLIALTVFAAGGWLGIVVLYAFDNRLTRQFDRFRVIGFAVRLSRDMRLVSCRAGAFAGILALSVLIHLFTVGLAWSLDHALGADSGYSVYFLAMIPTLLAVSIPVSIAGWGVREQALVVILGGLGVDAVHALSISIMFGLLLIVGGLPGGLIWLTLRRQDATAESASAAP
jgi:uncharacterized protein (TIRG00374 family)